MCMILARGVTRKSYVSHNRGHMADTVRTILPRIQPDQGTRCDRNKKAGDRDRTDDIQLGKLTFYH